MKKNRVFLALVVLGVVLTILCLVLVSSALGLFGPKETTETTATSTAATTISTTAITTVTTIPTTIENTSGNLVLREDALGTVSDAKFTNNHFGFEITLPSDWYVTNREEMNQLTKNTQTAVLGTGTEGEKIDLDSFELLPMLYAFKHPLTYTDGPNPSIVINAENLIGQEGTVKNSTEYLNLSKAMLTNQESTYEFSDITTATFGGQEFSHMLIVAEISGIQVTQAIYATLIDGFAIDIVLTYFSEEDKVELDAVMETIQF